MSKENFFKGLSGCTCFWDLDQLIGEEGLDDTDITVLFLEETFTCKGRFLKKELRRRDDQEDLRKIKFSFP